MERQAGRWKESQREGKEERKRTRSSGSHVVRHARDNQCNDVIVTVSQSRPIASLLHSNLRASGSKWKLDEFHRTLARLQFGLDHWEAWIRAVGGAPLDGSFASLSANDSSQRIVEFVYDDDSLSHQCYYGPRTNPGNWIKATMTDYQKKNSNFRKCQWMTYPVRGIWTK